MSLAELVMLKRAAQQVAELPKGRLTATRDRSPYETGEDKRWELKPVKHYCRWCRYEMRNTDLHANQTGLCARCDNYQTPCQTCDGPITRNYKNRRDVPIECGDCRTNGTEVHKKRGER